MNKDILEKIVIEPKSKATACVIWLHGLGDSGDGFAQIVPMLNLPNNHGIRFIFPHAPMQPVTINNGMTMRSWYDIKSFDLHNRADLDGVLASEQLVRAIIQSQLDAGIKSENIVLVGFSQGGVLSLHTGLRFEHKLAGIMALSCYLPSGDKLPDDLHSANKATEILQHHGTQDDVVPMQAGKMAHQLLVDNGYSANWQTYQMPHTLIENQINDIANWLKQRLC